MSDVTVVPVEKALSEPGFISPLKSDGKESGRNASNGIGGGIFRGDNSQPKFQGHRSTSKVQHSDSQTLIHPIVKEFSKQIQ